MVRFVYIILMSILALSQSLSQNIEDYLELKVSVTSDTVYYGDSLLLNITFKNLTDKKCIFYPRARFVLEKNVEISAFGLDYDGTYVINNRNDLTFAQELFPNILYEMTYPVYIDSRYFSKGENLFYLCYIFKPHLSILFRHKYIKHGSLFGVLRSNQFTICIK